MNFLYNPRNFIAIWLAWVAVAFFCRPLLPVDETRLVSMAWDIWNHHEVQTGYPPLFGWLIGAGWTLFGVNDWWPRVPGPLLALLCLFLTIRLGDALWPSRPRLGRFAPWLLLGSPVWGFWSTLVLEDMWLVASVLTALTGILQASRRGGWGAWLWWLAGCIAGILYSAPEFMLWILPVLFSASTWSGHRSGRCWWRFFLAALLLLMVAVLPLGVWCLMQDAGYLDMNGGSLWLGRWYALQGRSGHALSFAIWLVMLGLPWSCWPPLWRSLGNIHRIDAGLRICLIAVAIPVLVLCLLPVSGLHHLLPALPLLCLAGARLLASDNAGVRDHDTWLPGAVFALAALLMLLVPFAEQIQGVPAWLPAYLSEIPLAAVLTLLAFAVTLWWWRPARVLDASAGLAMLMVALSVLVHMVFAQIYYESYDLMPMAERIRALEANGSPVASWKKYRGEYTWLGRLKQPVEVLQDMSQLLSWVEAHPEGYVIAVYRVPSAEGRVDAEFWQPYRNHRRVGLWSAAKLGAQADALSRLAAD